MQDFRNLKVWQRAHQAVLEIHRESSGFPIDERYGMVTQIRRAGVSIASNIAEGCSRDSGRDFGHFLRMALGSANEAQYLLLLAGDLGFSKRQDGVRLESLLMEVRRMLIGLIGKLRSPNL